MPGLSDLIAAAQAVFSANEGGCHQVQARQLKWAGLQSLRLLAIIGLLLIATPIVAQEELAPEEATSEPLPNPAAPVAAPAAADSTTYFADVSVRGRPIFQVGSLADIDAAARAEIINRRIASLLARTDTPPAVTVQLSPEGEWATLQSNNRVLMTVTQQDAQDFGLEVEELAQIWAEQLNQALDRPPLVIDVAQRLNTTVRDLIRDVIDNLPSLIGAFLVLLVTWGIAQSTRRIAFGWARQTEGDRSTEVLVGRLGYGGVWIIGAIVALGLVGLNFGALLGALGLTSVAIGFSLKDVLSNYISGVILLAARPFRLGDQVVIGEYEGTIVQIQLRAMTMKTYDGRTVYIPNQKVFQASIINNTASTSRRSSVMVGIDYDADVGEAIAVIRRAVTPIVGVEGDPAPVVLVHELAASTVNLEVMFWVNSHRGEFLQTTSKVAQTVKEALQTAEIEMPTEIYTLVFRNAEQALKAAQSATGGQIKET